LQQSVAFEKLKDEFLRMLCILQKNANAMADAL
jgi:hypothetical protein